MDFSTSSLCVKWKKTASRCWCSRIFLLDLQPRCWNLHTAFQLIWDYPLLAPALVSAPATRTSLDANLFKNWNLGGDWNIWFFTQPIIAPVLFFQQTFPSRPIEFSWTLVAPHSLKNSSMLVILLSVLFFWDVLFYFAAIFCIAMQKVKDGGWMAQRWDFLLAWSSVCSFPLTSSPHLSVVLIIICMQPVVSVNRSEAYSPSL